MKVIETKNLTKVYGKHRGITDINLTVNQGDFFGFIGPNGAGKSTTIRVLFNFIFPTSGTAEIFGLDCVKNSEKIKETLGYVPSEVNYYKDMKVKELFSYAASFHKNTDEARLKKLIDSFEVDTSKSIGELSLGNRKKVAIVQSLIHRPKLLILDEPTNGLDPLIQNVLFEILAEENKNGMTIFFSSHNLTEVQRYCDMIGIIKEGKLIEVKKISELEGLQTSIVNMTVNSSENIQEFKTKLQKLNIKEFISNNMSMKFIYNGEMDTLVKLLADYHISELRIEEPTLEEIFMHYYERGDNK